MGAKENVFDAQGQVQLGKHVDAGNDNVIGISSVLEQNISDNTKSYAFCCTKQQTLPTLALIHDSTAHFLQ